MGKTFIDLSEIVNGTLRINGRDRPAFCPLVQPFSPIEKQALFPFWERGKLVRENHFSENTEIVLEKTSRCREFSAGLVYRGKKG